MKIEYPRRLILSVQRLHITLALTVLCLGASGFSQNDAPTMPMTGEI